MSFDDTSRGDPIAEEFQKAVEAEARRSAFAEMLTPLEQALICMTPIVIALEQVEHAAREGQMSAAGIYRKKEAAILTVTPSTQIELIGIKVPLQYADELRDALNAARATPFGKRLEEKIMAFADSPKAGKDVLS